MGFSSPKDVRTGLGVGLLGLMLSACAVPDVPEPPTPPAGRHPIVPLLDDGSDRVGDRQSAPAASEDLTPLRGPNTQSSRTPRSGVRIERELPALPERIETRTYPTPKVPGRGFDTAPVGTIDTRPGTIRPNYLEIPGR
ncbi:MAG: hypothetical protein NXI19_00975 [Alphaproteobacteria bacterium]|nr:hypothetical protein [Alphaproteobacteria bacterium]